jgi:NADPH:quinone reductase-like Zn-dependent oxidoreductase
MPAVGTEGASFTCGAEALEKASSMQALVADRYGPPKIARIETVARPPIGDAEALVRVHAASVCRGDTHLLAGRPFLLRLLGYGLLRPRHRIPGQNISGEVVTVGKDVCRLQPGDNVYGEIPHGAFAEYAAADARLLAPKPANLPHEAAAAVPVSALTALQALRDTGRLGPGQSVLVNGASGGVGTFAVQVAKALGAEVTAVCSTRHVELAHRLGADRVIDYTGLDFTRCDIRHDVVLDLAGSRSLRACKRVLKPDGIFVAASPGDGGPIAWMLKVALANATSRQRFAVFIARPNREDLLVLKRMIEEGRVRPVVEKRYPLHEAATALGHVAAGHAQGTSVIIVAPPAR